MVTDGIDSKRGLFHFPTAGNTVAGPYPRKSKHDQQLGRGKLYNTCSSQYIKRKNDVQSEIRSEALQLVQKVIEYYILMNRETHNNRIKSNYISTPNREGFDPS